MNHRANDTIYHVNNAILLDRARTRRGGGEHARLSRLCGAKAPGFSSSLRFSAGTRWRLEKLGGAERSVAEPKRETAGDHGGRSSPGVSNLRRGDRRGRVWSRRSHRLGSGNIQTSCGENQRRHAGAGKRETEQGRSPFSAVRRKIARGIRAHSTATAGREGLVTDQKTGSICLRCRYHPAR